MVFIFNELMSFTSSLLGVGLLCSLEVLYSILLLYKCYLCFRPSTS